MITFGEGESEGIIMIAEFTDEAILNPAAFPGLEFDSDGRPIDLPAVPPTADQPPAGESPAPPG